MRVLVTGGAGFIGHHVVHAILRDTDWGVVSLDRLDLSGNLNRLRWVADQDAGCSRRCKVVYGDLRSPVSDIMAKMLGDVRVVLHLAAASHVDRSIADPLSFVMDNVVGTCNALNYARELPNLERFIYFGTDEVFGPAPLGVQYSERDRYNSTNPYAASKAGGEELAVAFENTYGMPVFITHAINVCGERQHPEKYIPRIIRAVRDGELLTIHGNADATKAGSRHYIHANDVADALLFLLRSDLPPLPCDFGGAKCPKFNIVGKEEIDNLSLAQTIAEMMGKPLRYELVSSHPSRPNHDFRYSLSGDLLRGLGWESRRPIRESLKEIVEWAMKNPEWL